MGNIKLFPDLIVDQVLHRYEYFDLHSITWHHGAKVDSGHYTTNLKKNGIWYNANDKVITRSEQFTCDLNDNYRVPYIVVYRKRSTEIMHQRIEFRNDVSLEDTASNEDFDDNMSLDDSENEFVTDKDVIE